MAFEDFYINFLNRLPGITDPIKRLSFKDKLKWTGLILIIFFLLSNITVYGINKAGLQEIEIFELLLASNFGTLTTLGIGPIVVASIILQLLVGSKIIPWNLTEERGRMLFQGTQKIFAILLCFVEAVIYVSMGAIPPQTQGLAGIVMLQIALGGILIIFMDEVISKWGFGSGVGLFIVAGVSFGILARALNPFALCSGVTCISILPIEGVGLTLPTADNPPIGAIPQIFYYLSIADPLSAFLQGLLPVIATVLVFLLVIYIQSVKVEIPLAFGFVRGFGRRWPLQFLYTSVIPVILVSALLANVQLMARMNAQPIAPGSSTVCGWLGCFDQNTPISGVVYFLSSPTSQAIAGITIFIGIFALIGALIAYFVKKPGWKLALGLAPLGAGAWILLSYSLGLTGLITVSLEELARVFTYSLFMIGGATLFSVIWVTTSGMDAASVANQIQSTGMQIPGYRRDVRIIERVLNRYIPGLAVLGGMAIGFLAAYTDFTNALVTGTGILLASMIVYQLYQQITMQHLEDMHPAVRRLLGR